MSWSLRWVDHWAGDKDALSNEAPGVQAPTGRKKRPYGILNDLGADTAEVDSSPSLDQAHDALERIARYQQPE
ncbi:hypothetical protein HPQ64_08780 [Rhizobiales bacterium]|uniref:hypothetical protein n=1 Tax=Hongsoonwoonella zoysiae TaxID=2821844 RepID=UPI0015613CFD|nr:hypothetical protein [Hongsoonwoonella zoysiae]NRG17782.1 hypothetical protein [Hongsoonwoonella zoysiae]